MNVIKRVNKNRGPRIRKSNAEDRKPRFHFPFALESLEHRRMLTRLVDFDPAPGTQDADPLSEIVAVFEDSINPASATSQSFAIHRSQSSRRQQPMTSGNTITLSPEASFHPGELVQTTITRHIENVNGQPLEMPQVLQFRTATAGGSGYFGDSGQSIGSQDTGMVALGDLDGDGDVDAVVSNSRHWRHQGKIEVWFNDGAGRFAESEQYSGEFYIADLELGDLDGDGDLDAFLGNHGRYGEPNRVLFNDGDGLFTESEQSLGESMTSDVALGDLDGDGDLDAFVANGDGNEEFNQSDRIWWNDGHGSFSDRGERFGDEISDAIDLGDLDGDGDLDAVVGNSSNQVWLNSGNGTFSSLDQNLDGRHLQNVELGDLDGDGDLDAISNGVLLMNNGQGMFQAREIDVPSSNSMALGDLDGDGDLDAFFTYSGIWGGPNGVMLNDGLGQFHDSGQRLGHAPSSSVGLGDLDGDGDLDAFIGNYSSSYDEHFGNEVWFNSDIPADLSISVSNGQFLATAGQTISYVITARNRGPEDVARAMVSDDFPSDMHDIHWTCTASAGAFCAEGGEGMLRDEVSLPAGGTATYVVHGIVGETGTGRLSNEARISALGDLPDLDPENDVARDVDLMISEAIPGPGSVTGPQLSSVRVTFREITPTAISIHGNQSGFILDPPIVGDDTVRMSPTESLHHGEQAQFSLTGEIQNPDGTSQSVSNVWQLRTATNGGTGFLQKTEQELGAHRSRAVEVGDLDGDGDLDAFVGNGCTFSGRPHFERQCGNKVWLNDGHGNFLDSGQSIGDASSEAITLGDIDNDGDLDAIVGNGTRCGGDSCSYVPNMVWLNNGNGRFRKRTLDMFGATAGIQLGDLDGDGDLDVYVANWRFDQAVCSFCLPDSRDADQIWLNDGSGRFFDTRQRLAGSSAAAVDLGDFDNDGDLDAFVANDDSSNRVWLNDGSGHFVDSDQRLGRMGSTDVELGDLDGDGDLDAFVAGTSNRLWLNDGTSKFVESAVRFGEIGSDAVALGDLDGDGDLDVVLTRNDEQSGEVWINDGRGQFTPTNRETENFVGDAISLGDLDDDGDLDVFVAGGRYSAAPNTVWINQDRVIGDSNHDGNFSSADLVAVFIRGHFEDNMPNNSTFDDGDWNRDGDFDSSDFVYAFQLGNYLAAARAFPSQLAALVDRALAVDDEEESLSSISMDDGGPFELQLLEW